MKNVFFRYANDDFDKVSQFEFNSSLWVKKIDELDEDEILTRTDRRKIITAAIKYRIISIQIPQKLFQPLS